MRLYYCLSFKLTGRCLRFNPDSKGLCRNCRVLGAGA
jgi:hypothetical protein